MLLKLARSLPSSDPGSSPMACPLRLVRRLDRRLNMASLGTDGLQRSDDAAEQLARLASALGSSLEGGIGHEKEWVRYWRRLARHG